MMLHLKRMGVLIFTREGIHGRQIVRISHAFTAQVCMVHHSKVKVLPPTGLDTLSLAEHPILVILDLKVIRILYIYKHILSITISHSPASECLEQSLSRW